MGWVVEAESEIYMAFAANLLIGKDRKYLYDEWQ